MNLSTNLTIIILLKWLQPNDLNQSIPCSKGYKKLITENVYKYIILEQSRFHPKLNNYNIKVKNIDISSKYHEEFIEYISKFYNQINSLELVYIDINVDLLNNILKYCTKIKKLEIYGGKINYNSFLKGVFETFKELTELKLINCNFNEDIIDQLVDFSKDKNVKIIQRNKIIFDILMDKIKNYNSKIISEYLGVGCFNLGY